MKYFGAFGLDNNYNKDTLFSILQQYGLKLTQYDIIGFDSGAVFALNHAYHRICNNLRIGKLILMAPVIPHIYSNISMLPNVTHKYNNIITHIDYAYFVQKYNTTCWHKFSNICKNNFYNNSYTYIKSILDKHDNPSLQNISNLDSIHNNRNYWLEYIDTILQKNNNLTFIARKSALFVVFLPENDRIQDSGITLDIFSRIGICLFIKNIGHSFL